MYARTQHMLYLVLMGNSKWIYLLSPNFTTFDRRFFEKFISEMWFEYDRIALTQFIGILIDIVVVIKRKCFIFRKMLIVKFE